MKQVLYSAGTIKNLHIVRIMRRIADLHYFIFALTEFANVVLKYKISELCNLISGLCNYHRTQLRELHLIRKEECMEMGDDKETLKKGKAHIIVEIIEYVPNAVVSKTIIKKATGNITVSSFDEGEELAEKSLPYDSFVQVIDGAARLDIKGKVSNLNLGEGMVIPANTPHTFNADEQFKMIVTTIKSEYEPE